MIEIATNRRWERAKHNDNKDAKYGLYRYDTKFAFPSKNQNGEIIDVKCFDAELLICNASDGKKYLYDIVNIKKDNVNALNLKQKEIRKGSYQTATQNDVFTNIISDSSEKSNSNSKDSEERKSKRDTAYLEAVNNGDMETAQRMVDEYAEEVFANSKIRDEDGKLLKVYHGTYEDFTVFDKTKGRTNMDIQGMFFSPWDIDAKGYGPNVRAFYLNITNPANESTGYKALHMYTRQNNAGVKARSYLEKLGYDGVNNEDEEFIAFNSEQIKSADPVTYDDNGDIIPLSKRFDEKNEDIRYSQRYFENALSSAEWKKYNYAMISKVDAGLRISDHSILVECEDGEYSYKLVVYDNEAEENDIIAIYGIGENLYNDDISNFDQKIIGEFITELEDRKYDNKQMLERLLKTYSKNVGYILGRYNTRSHGFNKYGRKVSEGTKTIRQQDERNGVYNSNQRDEVTLYQPHPDFSDILFDEFDGEVTDDDARLITECIIVKCRAFAHNFYV